MSNCGSGTRSKSDVSGDRLTQDLVWRVRAPRQALRQLRLRGLDLIARREDKTHIAAAKRDVFGSGAKLAL